MILNLPLRLTRSQFGEAGKAFKLYAKDCDLFYFKSFSSDEVLSDIDEINQLDLEILSASCSDNIVAIVTSIGLLAIRCKVDSLALDTGRNLEVSDMATAARRASEQLKHL